MANYITSVNQTIAAEVAQLPHAVFYGENINRGSHISGLTRNLTRQEWVHYLGDEPYRKTCRNLPDPTD